MKRLGVRQKALLQEAARRYTKFHQGESLLEAWTGLGSATEYATAAKAGLMEIATNPNPGYITWWRLTTKGAAIVEQWISTPQASVITSG